MHPIKFTRTATGDTSHLHPHHPALPHTIFNFVEKSRRGARSNDQKTSFSQIGNGCTDYIYPPYTQVYLLYQAHTRGDKTRSLLGFALFFCKLLNQPLFSRFPHKCRTGGNRFFTTPFPKKVKKLKTLTENFGVTSPARKAGQSIEQECHEPHKILF